MTSEHNKNAGTAFQFKTVYEFVDTLIRPTYAVSKHRINDTNWSKRWWAHPEAVLRFYALWQTYEAGRQQAPATHLEPFLRVCCDYHLRFLMAGESVFADCKKRDTPSIPLPAEPVEGTDHVF